MKVYAGTDPISGKRQYRDETIPAGPRAVKEADKARTRLQAEVDQRRNPRTRATVGQMLDRHLSKLDVEPTTRVSYEGYVRNHIRPVLGELSLGRLVLRAAADVLRSVRRPPVTVPTGCSVFAREPQRPYRRWAERRFPNIRHWNEPGTGGHFAAFGQPALFVDEVRSLFRLVC